MDWNSPLSSFTSNTYILFSHFSNSSLFWKVHRNEHTWYDMANRLFFLLKSIHSKKYYGITNIKIDRKEERNQSTVLVVIGSMVRSEQHNHFGLILLEN